MSSLFIGGLGTGELVLIVVVLLLLFGSSKLPELMKGAGRGIREFKNAIKEPAEPKKDKEDNSEQEPKA